MANTQIKITDLAEGSTALSDFIVKAGSSGVATKITIQELSNTISTVGNSEFKGFLTKSQAGGTPADGWYFPSESGNYVLSNSQTVAITLSDKLNIIIIGGTYTTIQNIAIPLTTSFRNDVFDTTDQVNGATMSLTWKEIRQNYGNLITEITGKNLFCLDKITPEHYLLAGVVSPIADYFTSDYIAVLPSTSYVHLLSQIAQYDVNKDFISQSSSTDVTLSATTYFVRFSDENTKLATQQLELGAISTTFEAFKYKLKGFEDLMSSAEIMAQIENDSISYNLLVHDIGKNLFNKFTAIANNYIESSNGVVTASAGFSASQFIEILGSTAYIKTINNPLAFYDSSKVYISGLSGNAAASFTSPANAAFIRISVSDAVLNTEQLELGTVETFYEPFRFILPQIQVGYDNLSKQIKDLISSRDLKGLTWNSVGDSITEYNDYQPIVENVTGLVCTNYGVSSSTVAKTAVGTPNISMVQRVLGLDGLTEIPNADIWSLFGGINDEIVSDTPIGAFATSSFDVTTFYGAYQSIIEDIVLRTNSPKLLLITPLQSSFNGARIDSYRECILFLAKYYAIPVLDLYTLSGFTPITLNKFTAEASAPFIHPNDLGTSNYVHLLIKAISNL